MDEMNFDTLEERRVPVQFGGKRYVLREADGLTAMQYEDRRTAAHKHDPDTGKLLALGNINEATEAWFVGQCLWTVDERGEPLERVGEAAIRGWPARVVRPLFDRAKLISEMDASAPEWLEKRIAALQEQLKNPKPAEAAKNGQGATAVGSP